MKNLSERVLEIARTQNIKQIPRWYFLLIRFGMIALFTVTILVGAIAFGLLLDSLWPDTSMGMQGRGFKQMALGALPMIWLCFATLLISLGYFLFRHFRYGYRIRPYIAIMMVLSASLFAGMIAFKTNATFYTHRVLMHRVPPYQKLFEGHRRIAWVNPQEGRLAGEVIKVSADSIYIRDFFGKEWIVLNKFDTSSPKGINGGKWRFIGSVCGEIFCAEIAQPWKIQGKNGHQRMMHQMRNKKNK